MRYTVWHIGIFGVLGAALIVSLFLLGGRTEEPSIERPMVQIGGQDVYVEIADTPEARARGLSEHTMLKINEGMLFVFPEDDFHAFWMKDMDFSIDIIWLSDVKEVVDIASNVSPDTFPTAFSPSAPARYVLEVSAKFVEEHGVTIGDTVTFKGSHFELSTPSF